MENILLRFRDTENVNTIVEHQKIINKRGHVWWGWWKKDSEPERDKLLSVMKKQLIDFKFYLFDRSTERFFLLKIENLSFENGKTIFCPERDFTPNYYNETPLRLWLKVIDIETITIDDFFKSFPIIPNFDYTFFTESDLQREISELKSLNKRITLNSNYILHLSDIHFGADYGFPMNSEPRKRPLIEIISDYVNLEFKQKIGLLIISGDITSRGNNNSLLGEGLDFLNQLCDRLKIAKEAVIIIPGNHDIPLQDVDFKNYNHEIIYRSFLRSFYGLDTEPFGLNFYKFPCGQNIDILRINSVKLRKKEESNYGYVDWFHYKNLLANYNLDGDIKIAVIHHHLVSMSVEEVLDPAYQYGSISVTIDSGRVIDGLQANGFNFVLNGHQHIPGITKVARGKKNDTNEIKMNSKDGLTILSAGSAGVKSERFSDEMPYNSFSIYTISAETLDIEVKYYNPTMEPKRHYSSKLLLDQK